MLFDIADGMMLHEYVLSALYHHFIGSGSSGYKLCCLLQQVRPWTDDANLPDEWAYLGHSNHRGPITKAELLCYLNTALLPPDTPVCHISVQPNLRGDWCHSL